MHHALDEQYLILGGISTLDLKRTVDEQYRAGFIVVQQNYVGDDNWELVLIKNRRPRFDAS